MSLTRRRFVGAAALAAATLAGRARAAFAADTVARAEKPLRILILDGTGFTGPRQVQWQAP
jgi:2'-hydroxyisoflavone reductase